MGTVHIPQDAGFPFQVVLDSVPGIFRAEEEKAEAALLKAVAFLPSH
jgi:hypothetical protein